MKDAGILDKDLFKVLDVGKQCEACQCYMQKNLKPVVGLSLAKDFNETIGMDLKVYNGILFLHFYIVDNATRFSAAYVLSSKHKEVVIDTFFKHWVSLFDGPQNILSDNGREFNDELFRDMGELLNIRILCTAAESPWQNGMTERHHAIIENMIDRIIEDVNFSTEVALAWAVSAKNAIRNVYGYSVNQLVYGCNPNFPLLKRIKYLHQLLADHRNAVHVARKAFIESATTLVYETGDNVYIPNKAMNKVDRPW